MTAPPATAPRSSGGTIAQLSAMMFVQFWALGVWIVTVRTFIATNTEQEGEAIFSAGFIGYSASAAAMGSLLAPALAGWLTDRFLAPERLLLVLQFGSAAALWMMHTATSQGAFYLGMLLYFQTLTPCMVLCSTIALKRLVDRDREFPVVRLFGTAGWIAAGVFVGVVCPWLYGENIEPTRTPIAIGGWSHLVMAAYALTLPATRPQRPANSARGSRLGLLQNRSLFLFLVISMLAAVTSQPYELSNVYLNEQGYQGAAATLTLGQLSEVICLALLPWLRSLMRLKTMFLIGVLAWGVRYVCFAAGAWGLPEGLAIGFIYTAILLHGPAFAFVYLVGQMYVDRLVDSSNRGTAQGLHSVAMGGIGHLVGAGVTGWSQAAFLTPAGVSPPPYDWVSYWLTPVAISAVVVVLFAVFFSDGSDTEVKTEAATD